MGGLCHVNLFSRKHEILEGINIFVFFCKIGGFTKTLYFTSGGAMSRKGEYNRGYNINPDLRDSPWGPQSGCPTAWPCRHCKGGGVLG